MIALSIIALYTLSFFLVLIAIQFKYDKLKNLSYYLTILGFIIHGYLLIASLFDSTEANAEIFIMDFSNNLTKGYYLRLLSFGLVLIYIIFRKKLGFKLLSVTILPLSLLLLGLSFKVANVKSNLPPDLSQLFLNFHIGAFFISFALLVLGFAASVFFLYSENKIKHKKNRLKEFDPDLPALATCDNVNQLVTVLGFPLYTLGLASGFIWAGSTWGKTISWDAKELISIFNWLCFAYLFYLRLALNMRGKKTALLLILVFCIAILSLLSNFFIDSHHNFFTSNSTKP
ncbi:cytochrome c biogenesis protein CcsA [Desulfovibrio litoralis]|uniref:ABC-type uncharacterized transport system, permease component n=1 Tax=Desulfovibrio litoralis DSM 11393 TaxID=1121455 RepID=A0A1M7SD70_9BACT|nr:cytochrome c biogenesis protein CcsA [Desulfovibrio litoralis]SHN56429.1 ABC-type uncharacterized transport system, permease component [Desulfovibrio litoralis DSM 11393]